MCSLGFLYPSVVSLSSNIKQGTTRRLYVKCRCLRTWNKMTDPQKNNKIKEDVVLDLS